MLAAVCASPCDNTALRALIDVEIEEGSGDERVKWLYSLEFAKWENSGSWCGLFNRAAGHYYSAYADEGGWVAFPGFRAEDAAEIGRSLAESLASAKLAAWECLIRNGGNWKETS